MQASFYLWIFNNYHRTRIYLMIITLFISMIVIYEITL